MLCSPTYWNYENKPERFVRWMVNSWIHLNSTLDKAQWGITMDSCQRRLMPSPENWHRGLVEEQLSHRGGVSKTWRLKAFSGGLALTKPIFGMRSAEVAILNANGTNGWELLISPSNPWTEAVAIVSISSLQIVAQVHESALASSFSLGCWKRGNPFMIQVNPAILFHNFVRRHLPHS